MSTTTAASRTVDPQQVVDFCARLVAGYERQLAEPVRSDRDRDRHLILERIVLVDAREQLARARKWAQR